jgi:hypothetical protein
MWPWCKHSHFDNQVFISLHCLLHISCMLINLFNTFSVSNACFPQIINITLIMSMKWLIKWS